jgi:bacterioferritin-associated ferredoxin
MAVCPHCKRTCEGVEKITVAAHAKESCWPLGEEPYLHCNHLNCDVIYFTASGSRLLLKGDVKTRVTFKEKGSPRPLCYCKQVTEEDVIAAIENGARSFEDVKKATGIGGGGHCKLTNPAGKCCSRNYKPFIERELSKKGVGGDLPSIIRK